MLALGLTLSVPSYAQDYAAANAVNNMSSSVSKLLQEIKDLINKIGTAYGFNLKKGQEAIPKPQLSDEQKKDRDNLIAAANQSKESTTRVTPAVPESAFDVPSSGDNVPPQKDPSLTMHFLKNTLTMSASPELKPGEIPPLLYPNFSNYLSMFNINKPFKEESTSEEKNNQNHVLNINTLLAPTSYQKENTSSYSSATSSEKSQSKDALNFIRFLSAIPSSVPLLTRNEFRNMGENRKDYLARLRNYAANLSVALSNFEDMYAKRLPKKDQQGREQGSLLGTLAKDASTRMSEEWYKDMEQATPLKMQQETLKTLNSINMHLHLSYLQNERILATLSTLQLQSLETTKAMIKG